MERIGSMIWNLRLAAANRTSGGRRTAAATRPPRSGHQRGQDVGRRRATPTSPNYTTWTSAAPCSDAQWPSCCSRNPSAKSRPKPKSVVAATGRTAAEAVPGKLVTTLVRRDFLLDRPGGIGPGIRRAHSPTIRYTANVCGFGRYPTTPARAPSGRSAIWIAPRPHRTSCWSDCVTFPIHRRRHAEAIRTF